MGATNPRLIKRARKTPCRESGWARLLRRAPSFLTFGAGRTSSEKALATTACDMLGHAGIAVIILVQPVERATKTRMNESLRPRVRPREQSVLQEEIDTAIVEIIARPNDLHIGISRYLPIGISAHRRFGISAKTDAQTCR